MENKKIIRAADYIPAQKEDDDDNPECYGLPASEKMLYNLFGESPNYSKKKFEKIWEKIMDSEDKETIAYCLEKGVDVMDDDGEPVAGWRDIAVMLKAIDKGLLKLEDRK